MPRAMAPEFASHSLECLSTSSASNGNLDPHAVQRTTPSTSRLSQTSGPAACWQLPPSVRARLRRPFCAAALALRRGLPSTATPLLSSGVLTNQLMSPPALWRLCARRAGTLGDRDQDDGFLSTEASRPRGVVAGDMSNLAMSKFCGPDTVALMSPHKSAASSGARNSSRRPHLSTIAAVTSGWTSAEASAQTRSDSSCCRGRAVFARIFSYASQFVPLSSFASLFTLLLLASICDLSSCSCCLNFCRLASRARRPSRIAFTASSAASRSHLTAARASNKADNFASRTPGSTIQVVGLSAEGFDWKTCPAC
mmetsp:Transcript_82963/g.231461  ORF Transcript_82963/g.231461 Transcript_82963/m.231461 type:complete len:311 (-) Transcript_82963:2-934(-)